MKWNGRFLRIAAMVAISSLSGPSLLAQTPARPTTPAAPAPATGAPAASPSGGGATGGSGVSGGSGSGENAPSTPGTAAPAFIGTAPKISNELSSASNALTAQQQQQLDAYAGFWYQKFTTGTDDQIAEARVNLLDPLQKPGITDIFRQGYDAAVISQLEHAFESDRITVRVNTMIIAQMLGDLRLLRGHNLLTSGMKDGNPAVRYWTAKAIAAVNAKSNVNKNDKQQLMNLLVGQMVQESSEFALQQIMLALSDLNSNEATEELLRGINQRVSLHIREPGISLTPERDALLKVYQRIVQAKAGGGAAAPPDAIIKQLGLVSFRYLMMSAGLLDMKRVNDPARVPEFEKTVANCDSILRWVREMLAPQSPAAPSIDDVMSQKKWAEVRLRSEDWRKTLTTAPLSLPMGDLEVPLNVN